MSVEVSTYQQRKKDYIAYELWRRSQIEKHVHARYWLKQKVYDSFRDNVIGFINEWVYTYDPRNIEIGLPTRIPLKLFDKQEELVKHVLWCMDNTENGLIEKSRDMGLTWIICAIFVHKWIYEKGFKAGIGSRKLNLVDKIGDLDSILQKIRFIITNLPPFFLPEQFKASRDLSYCKIINPDNGSTITGEGGTDIGRGGRNSVYFVDEHAKIEKADMVDASLSQNTNCILYGSTPYGMGNLFAKKRFSSQVNVFTMHWTAHPFKNKEWYDRECEKYDETTIAQELDIDYSASVEGICVPAKWVRKCVNLDIPETGKKQAGVDVGGGTGSGESVYIYRHGGVVKKLEHKSKSDPNKWALQSARYAERDGVHEYCYDAIGVGAGIGGTIQGMERKFTPKLTAVNSGDRPSKKRYDDNPKLRADERFQNIRAEMWWAVRERFRKTVEMIEYAENLSLTYQASMEALDYLPDELISIPDDSELILQLSLPTVIEMSTGKVKIESKKDMVKRGIKSPDRADALVYSFSDIKIKKRKPLGSQSNKPMG